MDLLAGTSGVWLMTPWSKSTQAFAPLSLYSTNVLKNNPLCICASKRTLSWGFELLCRFPLLLFMTNSIKLCRLFMTTLRQWWPTLTLRRTNTHTHTLISYSQLSFSQFVIATNQIGLWGSSQLGLLVYASYFYLCCCVFAHAEKELFSRICFF